MEYRFALKPQQEILSMVKDESSVCIVSCNGCYKEVKEFPEKRDLCHELYKVLIEAGKKIIFCKEMDFICNSTITERNIPALSSSVDSVCTLCCGIGTQVVANILEKANVSNLIHPMANTISKGGYESMTIGETYCLACGDCILDLTAGICPIVNCSKQLLNGPCGGAKNGKCEVKLQDGTQKDCAWEKIYNRLEKLKKKSPTIVVLPSSPAQVRDYSKPAISHRISLINQTQQKRLQSFYGGVYPSHKKEFTENKHIETLPEPEIVIIPLLQHAGAICEPIVKIGDKVKIGQKIGSAKTLISANIHSSISGEVIAIEEHLHPLLKQKIASIVIQNDRKSAIDDTIQPNTTPENLTSKELIEIIKEKGIVGLGGAMFPTHVKLQPPKLIDTLIINGCECEPYLTADYRIMIEKTTELLLGTKIIAKILNAETTFIAIEDNKPEAIKYLKEKTQNLNFKAQIVELKTKYPQGAERMLIKKVLDREVPLGGLPFDVGVIVSNVSTAYAIYEAVVKGLPLIKRVITVSGENCTKPGNYQVKIGTLLKDIITHCFGFDYTLLTTHYSVKMGGPMMGIEQETLEVPIVKGSTGVVSLPKKDIELDLSRPCIRCGRCVDACPMMLLPLNFGIYAEFGKYDLMKEAGVMNCIECGCCDYVCPAKRSLVEAIKTAKNVNSRIKT